MTPSVENGPPWFQIAMREIGVKEKFGDSENSRILQYFLATSYHAGKDEVPWCAAFVSWCLEQAGVHSKRSARAASYRDYGEQCMLKKGAIVYLGKADPDAGGSGHVAFFDSWNEDKTLVLLLGGNQRNQVCIAPRPVSRIEAVRWPIFP